MLIGAQDVISLVRNYRLAWVAGHFGAGKTAFAFMLAHYYLENGYRLISNCANIWQENIEDIDFIDEDGHLKVICILDEGGLIFQSGAQIKMIAAYARKMDCIFIIPSVWAPCIVARALTIQPLFGFQSAGIPLICYQWRINYGGYQDRSTFFWFDPSEIYGIYSSQDPATDGSEIIQFLVKKTEQFKELQDRKHGRTKQIIEIPELEKDGWGLDNDVVEAAGVIESQTDELISILGRARRRK